MKVIGLIGGISWKSTAEYYQILNTEINKRLGGVHSAEILMYSFDFDEIDQFNRNQDFEGAGIRLAEVAGKLEQGGAGLLLLCANTAHMSADKVKAAVKIPLIHIADATGKEIVRMGCKKVLLLGTRFTMEGDFISGKLRNDYGLEVVVPEKEDRDSIHDIIYKELVIGAIRDTSHKLLVNIINNHPEVDGVILGCTELPLIIRPEDTKLPLFNTTALHAKAAADFALS